MRKAMIAVATLLLAGCSGHSMNHSNDSMGASDADISFVKMMIPHHEQAVKMADMANREGLSAELTELAAAIRVAQQPEIDQMKQWLDEWGVELDSHASHMGGHDMTGMMSDDDMKALDNATGAEFEKLWLTMMIEHHQGAIEMANQVRTDGSESKVRSLAEAIIAAQKTEIAQMTGMLAKI